MGRRILGRGMAVLLVVMVWLSGMVFAEEKKSDGINITFSGGKEEVKIESAMDINTLDLDALKSANADRQKYLIPWKKIKDNGRKYVCEMGTISGFTKKKELNFPNTNHIINTFVVFLQKLPDDAPENMKSYSNPLYSGRFDLILSAIPNPDDVRYKELKPLYEGKGLTAHTLYESNQSNSEGFEDDFEKYLVDWKKKSEETYKNWKIIYREFKTASGNRVIMQERQSWYKTSKGVMKFVNGQGSAIVLVDMPSLPEKYVLRFDIHLQSGSDQSKFESMKAKLEGYLSNLTITASDPIVLDYYPDTLKADAGGDRQDVSVTTKANSESGEDGGMAIPDTDEGVHDDLPESDAGKAAAALGTAVGGALLGAIGAFGGIGGGGAAGGVGVNPDGNGPYEDSWNGLPDNMNITEDGSIRLTTPTGETLVYTPNADGTYNLPTQTETGENLTYQDENGNWRTVEPGTISTQEVLEGAKWYKEHEQELQADRAAEDARRQAERDRLAEENAAWLEKQHAINNQRSQYGLDVQKELKMMEQQQAKEMYMDKLHWKYDPVGKDLSDEELKTVVKREQIKNNIKGGLYEQEAAKWDNHLITAQEVKFGADQAINAYGILTHNQAFATAYSACTNYSETMVDAKLNNKDTGKAFLKATIDTGLDALANKFESHGWHITGNAFSGAYKQVNDNVYNGRDAWDNTDTAAVYGGVMGTVSKGIAKLGELSQGTVLGKNIGGSAPDVDVNPRSAHTDLDVDTKGIRPTTIAERRLGQGQIHTNTPMSDADVKMSINEDVQAIRSMNDVRQLNKISTRMDTIEKANPRTYQNNAEYQKLSQQFETQRAKVSEDMVAVDRMNAIQGETGTNLRQRYNQSAMAYENKVLQHRNESIVESTGLKTSQIGDFHASSNKDAIRAAGGPAAHDLDTSPNVKVETGTGKNKSVDFSQTDGDHHLVRGIYKAEHGRYPQTAAEYAEGQKLAQDRHFTNVSTRPSDTHEIKHNPEAYVGSGKGEVNKVLQPEKYGTPDKGTGVLNEQTAIHKQRAPLEQHRQQYAEAQDLRTQLKTDKSLSAAEKTEMGQKIATLERQSASNHYEATRTTAKENGVIKGINDANETKGLAGGMGDDAKYIGEQAQLVREGKQTMATYKQIVKEKYGSEEKAQEILAHGFRDTNK